MTTTTKSRLHKIAGVCWLVVAAAAIVVPLAFMVSCAAGTSSEITPAESKAAEKTLRFTPESAKRSSTKIRITLPKAEVTN